jgi:flavodoxin
MKALVVYASQSGNTKKLADVIYEFLPCDKEIYPVTQAPDPGGFDLVAVGFWLKAGKPDGESTEYLATVKNTSVFLFATHGAAANSEHAQNAMTLAESLLPTANILGSFNCPGEVNPKVIEKVKSNPEPPAWLKDAPSAVGRPNEADFDNLKTILAESMSNVH